MTSSPDPYTRFPASPAPFSRCQAKKGPENRISVVDGKPGGVRERPMTDPSVSITRRPQAGTLVPGCPPVAGAGTTVARTFAVRATVAPSRYPPARRPALPRRRPLLAGRAPARTGAWLGAGCQARPGTGPGRLDAAAGVEGGCLRSRAAGQPAPPARSRAGCLRLRPRQRRGRAVGHRPGPRAWPCRPSPPAGAGRPSAPAPSRGLPPFSARGQPLPVPPAPRSGVPGRAARAGPDLTRRAERSVRRRGPTDGSPPRTPTAPGRPPRHPGRRTRHPR
jgi:hypothetical protein